jgi:hypothetical protein
MEIPTVSTQAAGTKPPPTLTGRVSTVPSPWEARLATLTTPLSIGSARAPDLQRH